MAEWVICISLGRASLDDCKWQYNGVPLFCALRCQILRTQLYKRLVSNQIDNFSVCNGKHTFSITRILLCVVTISPEARCMGKSFLSKDLMRIYPSPDRQEQIDNSYFTREIPGMQVSCVWFIYSFSKHLTSLPALLLKALKHKFPGSSQDCGRSLHYMFTHSYTFVKYAKQVF